MGTIAVTGSAGGIGIATRARLEADGHAVIGVDVRDAEVVADLSTTEGRHAMVDGVMAASGGILDGVVAGAGLTGEGGQGGEAGLGEDVVVSVNHFGAVATLDGLRPLLAAAGAGAGASAIAISSNSTTTMPGYPLAVTDACLAGDEEGARVAAKGSGIGAYGASKLALARWVRRRAVGGDWAGSGIRLNAIAPGFIDTPMTATQRGFILGLGELFPMPQQRPGEAVEVAGLIAYLLSAEASYFCGSVVFMDGGTDAALRPDSWPAPIPEEHA